MGSVLADNTNNNGSFNHTKKHQVTVHGLTTVFASSKEEINLDHLQEHVASKIPQNHHLYASTPATNSHTQERNHHFVEFATLIIPLINDCIENCDHNTPQVVDSPPFKFKTSRLGKPTVFDKHWKDHFKELEDFKKQHGHTFVSRMTAGYQQLGNWLIDQRRKFRKGKLTREQYDLLTSLGVEWDRSNH